MPDLLPFVGLRLSWSRRTPGVTAVFRAGAESVGWVEIGRTAATEFVVEGLHPERSHMFAAAAVRPDGSVGPEHEWEMLRVAPMADAGRPALPGTPAGFAATQDGAKVNLRWDAATDDVTASYEIRVGATWEDGKLVADGLPASPYTWPWWSSGTLVFWLAAIDKHGRASRAKASRSLTVSALVDHVTANTLDESGGGWAGTKGGMAVDGAALRLASVPAHFGAATTPPFGAWSSVPCFGRYQATGTYVSATLNLGQLEQERIEVDTDASQPIDAGLPFGAVHRPALGARARRDESLVPLGTRGFSSRNSWRATPLVPVDIGVEIDTSPTNAGAWDGYRPYVPGTYTFWRARIRMTVRGDGLRYVTLPRLRVLHRRLNKKAEGVAALPGGGPYVVAYGLPAGTFRVAPVVTCTLQNATVALGVKIEVQARTRDTCTIEAFNAAGASIACDVGWHALGP